MDSILQNKLNELQNASDYECWYLVKQPTAFDNLCYLVSFLKEFKEKDVAGNLQDFIGQKIIELKSIKSALEISNNYRALRVAAFFGLITMTSSKYDEAIITDTFEEIYNRCSGEFEKTDMYSDIIQRQIEKMFLSSSVDEEYNGIRQEYRLYPVMLLYKVLLELGRSTGKYSISMTEYRYLVATTKVFEGFLETLLLIKLLRDDATANNEFEQYRTKFDNRLIQALKQLNTLKIDKDSIAINSDLVSEVAKKVYIFEENPNIFSTENYLDFLGSTNSLFELDNFDNNENDRNDECLNDMKEIDEKNRLRGGTNVLLYGVPGCGKSYTIKTKYCKDADSLERVVFHPDYTYGDFVGQIMPMTDEGTGKIRYEFAPGPFTRILSGAYNNPEKKYCLVIEEINRGNAPAIFGDIFQMLDRDEDGSGSYDITNVDVAEKVYIYNKDTIAEPNKIKLPSNLYIFATMNTSDQNVFTLDTAFQRRWNMRMIENDVSKSKIAGQKILDTNVKWAVFNKTINELVISKNVGMTSSEDKRLGAYFVTEKDLYFFTTNDEISQEEADDRNHNFPEKVLKYLWDDAFKFTRDEVFKSQYDSLEKLIKAFEMAEKDERFNVFLDDIFGLSQNE
ncbi:McrB family protein [Anaerosporobacter sp.]|uniref:McrB family protein n=1 Tax=Anaerosporobacter sp. TaxID=1872529 RepID=UPI00286F55A0|nr:AAA family ATPase [Anaerosporobacter sp.]